MIATIVHTDELLSTVAAASVAGIGVTFLFSLGIWGAGQFAELSRDGKSVLVTAAAAVSVLAFVAVAAAVVVGMLVMTNK